MENKTQPIEPITVAVIGGTGDGTPLTSGTTGTTPDHQPNLVVQVVTPIAAITVRALNTFCITVVGLLTAGAMSHELIPAGDFIMTLRACAGLSLGVVIVGIIKDCATIFSGLEKKFPLGTGSV